MASNMRMVFYGILILLVAGGVFAVMSHERPGDSPDPEFEPLPPEQDLSLNNIHHVATQDGVTEWTLDAESARYHRTENKTVFKEVAATFFLENGGKVLLQGRDGILMTDTKNMEVSGDVVLQSGPYKLTTEKLVYEHESKTVSAMKPVTIRGKGVSVAGARMVFNMQKESLVMSGGVEAVIEQQLL